MNLAPGDTVVCHYDGFAFRAVVDWVEDEHVVVLNEADGGKRWRVAHDQVVPYRSAPPWLIDLAKRGRTADRRERDAMSTDGWRRRRDENLRRLFERK
jgi:hypothetical protein